MRDWPDPGEQKGSAVLLYLEFWGIAAITMIGFGMAYGRPLIGFLRSIFIAI